MQSESYDNKVMSRKHLSRIILGRTGITITVSFIAMMVITSVFILFYGKKSSDSFIRFCLSDINHAVQSRMDYNTKNQVQVYAAFYDEVLSENRPDASLISEITNDLKSIVKYNVLSEIDIVDPDGSIIISTSDEIVGFDLGSNPESAELLDLLKSSEDVIIQDMKPRALDGTLMKYAGAPLPSYGGLLLYGIDSEEYALFKSISLDTQVKNVKIGRGGYYLVLDSDAAVISSPYQDQIGDTLILSRDIHELAEKEAIIKDKIYGVRSYIGIIRDGDNYIAAVYPMAEAWETWVTLMLAMIAIYAVVFAILFFVIRHIMTQQVVRGVESLNGTLLRITEGNLGERADFSASIEFEELSGGINITVDRLKELMKEAEGRLDSELELAAKIQTAFLPNDLSAISKRCGIDLFAAMNPAKNVGGDFYDFFLTDKDHLALIMADVSGKGLPAAMFMVAAKNKIRESVMKHGADVSAGLKEANLEIMKENKARLFVTVWLGVLTLSTGHMDYVNAGHEYPAIRRNGERFRADKDVHSVPVAASRRAEFDPGAFELGPGDTLFLYTDGITEANDSMGEMFGRERMLDALNKAGDVSAEETDVYLRSVIAEFTKGTPQFDDMTTLVLRYRGKSL